GACPRLAASGSAPGLGEQLPVAPPRRLALRASGPEGSERPAPRVNRLWAAAPDRRTGSAAAPRRLPVGAPVGRPPAAGKGPAGGAVGARTGPPAALPGAL